MYSIQVRSILFVLASESKVCASENLCVKIDCALVLALLLNSNITGEINLFNAHDSINTPLTLEICQVPRYNFLQLLMKTYPFPKLIAELNSLVSNTFCIAPKIPLPFSSMLTL